MFELAIEAAKALASAAGTLIKLGNERRTKLASYFDNISNAMKKFVDSRRQGKESAGLCAELAQYAKAIRDVASPTLQPEEIERLVNELENACSNWKKLSLTDIPDNQLYDEYLDEIESAAGSFRGFANVLRTM